MKSLFLLAMEVLDHYSLNFNVCFFFSFFFKKAFHEVNKTKSSNSEQRIKLKSQQAPAICSSKLKQDRKQQQSNYVCVLGV